MLKETQTDAGTKDAYYLLAESFEKIRNACKAKDKHHQRREQNRRKNKRQQRFWRLGTTATKRSSLKMNPSSQRRTYTTLGLCLSASAPGKPTDQHHHVEEEEEELPLLSLVAHLLLCWLSLSPRPGSDRRRSS